MSTPAAMFLKHVAQVIAERSVQYGDAAPNMSAIAARWSATLGREITPAQVDLLGRLAEKAIHQHRNRRQAYTRVGALVAARQPHVRVRQVYPEPHLGKSPDAPRRSPCALSEARQALPLWQAHEAAARDGRNEHGDRCPAQALWRYRETSEGREAWYRAWPSRLPGDDQRNAVPGRSGVCPTLSRSPRDDGAAITQPTFRCWLADQRGNLWCKPE